MLSFTSTTKTLHRLPRFPFHVFKKSLASSWLIATNKLLEQLSLIPVLDCATHTRCSVRQRRCHHQYTCLLLSICVFQEPAVGCVEGDSCHTGLQHHPGLCPSDQCCRLRDSCHDHSKPLEEETHTQTHSRWIAYHVASTLLLHGNRYKSGPCLGKCNLIHM